MLIHIIIYLLSFAGIWVGSGLAIKSVEKLSRILKASSFAVSFLVLGFFTSVGELSVGINSILKNDPEIYVGNLIGSNIVIFIFIIPLLAITGSQIRISAEFKGFNLPASLVVVAAPVILIMDGKVGRIDSLIMIVLYGFLMLSVQVKRGLFKVLKNFDQQSGIRSGKEFVKIIFGLTVIFIASKFVVDKTLYFSQLLHVSPFLISLLLISIGTNVPELSLVVRSLFMRNNQVAFGNYVGSAAFNTFLLGFLTIIYGRTVFLVNSYFISLLFFILGLIAFYYFSKTKDSISRLEGLILLVLYILFLLVEISIHKSLF